MRKRRSFAVVIFAAAVAACAITLPRSWGQATPAPSTRAGRGARGARAGRGGGGPALVSPEVSADRRITIRLRAPQATEVTVSSTDFTPPAMTKDANGVWTGTTDTLPPQVYVYALHVDGVQIADPSDGDVQNIQESIVTVPGNPPMPWEMRDVPHGNVTEIWYDSKAIGMERRFHVYTPPGYDGGTEKYPILYLLHGSGDDDSVWTECGKANLIEDNLIADGKAKPCIIVMPHGQLVSPNGARGTLPTGPNAPQFSTQRYEDELLHEIIPMVEKTYRVEADPAHTAMAGLSMGGAQTAAIGVNHPELFGNIGLWSTGGSGNPATTFAGLAAQLDTVKHSFKVIDIGVGLQDSLLTGSQAIDKWFTDQGISHDFHPIPGVHQWPVWRVYLSEFLPKFTAGM